jgi:hypothetical protein
MSNWSLIANPVIGNALAAHCPFETAVDARRPHRRRP